MGKTLKVYSAKKMGKQPTMGQKKTKEAIAKAAANAKKGGKKKWSKGKVKDKLNNKCYLDEATYKAINKEVTNMGMVTISNISEKYKVMGSIAKKVIRYLREDGKVVPFGHQHHGLMLYCGAAAMEKEKKLLLSECT